MSKIFTKLPLISKNSRNILFQSYSSATKKSIKSICGSNKSGSKSEIPPKGKQKEYGPCHKLKFYHGQSQHFRTVAYCVLPVIGFLSFKVFSEHEELDLHYVPYAYMYKRIKRIFYGDHFKTFFHGPNNFIPEKEEYDGKQPKPYEEDLERRKELRKKHAQDELERRKERRQEQS